MDNSICNESSEPPAKKMKFKLRPPTKKSDEISLSSENSLPQHLLQSRDNLFSGIEETYRQNIQMDIVGSFSITESRIADRMTHILSKAMSIPSNDICILDGMACCGGNSISFCKTFGKVISNELDLSRFEMLSNNLVNVLGYKNVELYNKSILELATSSIKYDILFLDPEWGGPDYKYMSTVRLKIGDEFTEDFCLRVFQNCPQLSMIALKLPTNYDNDYIKSFCRTHDYKYTFYDNFFKMTLSLIQREVVTHKNVVAVVAEGASHRREQDSDDLLRESDGTWEKVSDEIKLTGETNSETKL